MRSAPVRWVVGLYGVALAVSACAPETVVTDSFDLAVPGGGSDGGPGPGADLVARDLAMGPCGMCAEPTPICDPQSRRCVGCLKDDDCPMATVCKAGQCAPGCSAQRSACGDAGSCDLDGGVCHGCLADRDCKDVKAPLCDVVSGRCFACLPDRDRCPDGAYCAAVAGGYGCMLGCRADGECAVMFGANGGCCEHVCVNLSNSRDHCGACGGACGNGTCCARRCVDQQTDARNCGGCGFTCPALNTDPECKAGKCEVGACVVGFADCDKSPANGCEVSIGSDRNHCGGCGQACSAPNANSLCINSACVLGGCLTGFLNCDGNGANGCEINAQIDNSNCGNCGAACAQVPNAIAACMKGGCAVAACLPGYGNCDALDNNGCEVDLATTAAHCGACGKACPSPPNVATGCANGMCSMGGCVKGFGDCDGNGQNGCEANLDGDLNHCGACGNTCQGMGQNAVAACVKGMCSLSCNKGFGDCDNNLQNGCETNVDADKSNCGACGKVCPFGQACAKGMCIAYLSYTAVTGAAVQPVQSMGSIPGMPNLKVRITRIGICGDADVTSGPQGFRATDSAGLDFTWGAGQNMNGGLTHYLTPTPDLGGSARGFSYLDVNYTGATGKAVDVSFVLYSDWDGRFCAAMDEDGNAYMDAASTARAWIKYSYEP